VVEGRGEVIDVLELWVCSIFICESEVISGFLGFIGLIRCW
jgi:hypothetical protein